MPTRWNLDLTDEVVTGLGSGSDELYRLARHFLFPDGIEDKRDEEPRPFAVRAGHPDDRLGRGPRITLSWLKEDGEPPRPASPPVVTCGRKQTEVAAASRQSIPYETLETAPVTTRVRFSFHTPAVIKHHDHDYPLPEPYVTYVSLGRRYLALRQGTLTWDLVRDVARSAAVRDHDVRTRDCRWEGHTHVGYTGTATFAVSDDAPAEVREAFTTLSLFAGLAGLGRGTTHGLGAVDVVPLADKAGKGANPGSRRPQRAGN